MKQLQWWHTIALLFGLHGLVFSIGCGETQSIAEKRPTVTSSENQPAKDRKPSPQTRSEVGKADGANLKTEPSSRDIVALVADKSSTRNISFDDIAFKMEKDDSFKRSMLTEKIVTLADKSVRIRGFILPSFKQDGLTEFVLVRDNMECCFGPGAALYDCIMVRMQFGESTSFSVRPVAVEGRFSIEEWRDFDGVVRAIYHIQGLSVK
ncbi:MAG: DUF3299 domain-containing protein [Pirellulales bacterium]|nr:DUF3299 domain-containing protein [Pirellulales bacterium]